MISGNEQSSEHGDEIADRIVGQFGIERVIDRHAAGADQERSAVWRRLGDIFGGDDRAAARLVLNNHRLAEIFRQFLPEHARDDVVAAAGRETDDDVDRPRWIFCRIVQRERRAGGEHGQPEAESC